MFSAFQQLCAERIEEQCKQTLLNPTYCRDTIQCNDAVLCILPLEENKFATSHSTLGMIQVWDTNKIRLRSFGQVNKNMDGWKLSYPPTDEMSWLWDITKVGTDQMITSSYEVGAMRVFNWRTGELMNTIRHDEPIAGLGHENLYSFGQYVIAGLEDRTITIWDITKQGGTVHQVMEKHEGWVYCMETLPDGNLASGAGDNMICIWDMNNVVCRETITTGHNGVLSLQYIHQMSSLISAGTDDTIKVWDINSLNCISTLFGHENRVKQVKYIGGDLIVSVSDDKTVRVWDLRSAQCINILCGHSSTICNVTIVGREVLSGSEDGTVKIWS
jgi:WD40 repeat protein